MVKKQTNKQTESERGIMPPKQLFAFVSTVIKSKPGDMGPPASLDFCWYSEASGGSTALIDILGYRLGFPYLASKNMGHLIKFEFQVNSK